MVCTGVLTSELLLAYGYGYQRYNFSLFVFLFLVLLEHFRPKDEDGG